MSPPPEYPRITYQTEGRTFDRLFKEQSLHETKLVVRKKLGLGHAAPIELAQIRDGRKIDLEDDDDFEAFRALANSSLHATVAVTIPPSGSSSGVKPLGEKRRRPHEVITEIYPHGRAEPSASASIPESPTVQLPSMHVTGTRRPRKKRKVTFNCDPVTSQPPLLSENVVRPSSPNPAPPSTALALPSKTTEQDSTRVPATNSGKPKSNPAKVTHQDDEAVVPTEMSRKKRKKKDGPPKGSEPSPDHGKSALRDISPLRETQVKRVRKKAKNVPPEPTTEVDAAEMLVDRQHEQFQEAASVTADASLHKVAERAKPGEQEPQLAKAKGGRKKSKSKLGDPAEDETLDSTKSLKRKVPKNKALADASTVDVRDDIDKTIAALLDRRMHTDPEAFSDPVTEIDLAIPSGSDVLSADSPPTGARKRSRLRTPLSPEENQRLSNGRRPPASQGVDEQDMVLATAAPSEETATARPRPTVAVQPSESESGPARRKRPHTLEGSSADEGGITQAEKNMDTSPASSKETTATLRTLTANAQSVLSTGNTPRVPSFLGRSAFGMGLRTGAKPTIPEGLAISGVPVEAHGEGSSDESSSEDEDEEGAVPLANPATSISDDPSIPMNLLEDQLTDLIRGPEKRGPRRSVLDEIPSSSETGSESSPEDLMLDEEEDLSRQPSRKQKTFSKNRLSSIEPELDPSLEDEESASLHVFMDTPDEVQHYLPPGEPEVASADAAAERGAPEPTELLLESQRQGISASVQTPSDTRPETDTRTASPESDATAINTEPTKPPILASTERQSGRVLVPASSPFVTKVLVNAGKKVQIQDEIDDVEPADESYDGRKESDPIEPEPNEPSVDLTSSHASINPNSHQPRRPASRTTLNPSDSEQPSRRSGRLANRQPHIATPVLARQPDRKASLPLKKSATKQDHEQTDVAESSQEKPTRKQAAGKGRKPANQTTQSSTNLENEVDGSARAPNPSLSEWTTLPPPSETQTSTTDQRSPGPVRPLLPVGNGDIGEDTPMPNRRGVTAALQGKGGGQPLFLPGSSSQAPRTQTAPSPSPSPSESETENVAFALPKKTPIRSTPNGGTFRSLSILASQEILFPKVRAAKSTFFNTPSLKVKRPVLDDEDDEESSSSGDDTSEAHRSHIPKDRRVGTTPRRKGSRLLSLAKLGQRN